MDLSFNPGRSVPEPDALLLSDPFYQMIEKEGRERLAQRYDYIANILEEEFEETYMRFFSGSILHYEVINLITLCSQLLEDTGFPNNDSRFLRYNVIATIQEYLSE